ncbi:MAG: DNA-3-methyladenine glycosylase [Candidatus Saccharibacteria bacterium]
MDDDQFEFLSGDVVSVAQRLLGCELVLQHDGREVIVRVVETEAYHQTDAASHSYKGRTPRTDIMFGPPGFLYVYFTYGMHYCMNVVTGQDGEGSAVLIRAVEPVQGRDILMANRPGQHGQQLTNGPAKLCQALGIDKSWNGHDLRQKPLVLRMKPALHTADIVQTVRVGISQAQDKPWRFYIRDSLYVSKPIK